MSLKKLFGAGFVLALATACTSTYTTKDPAFTELYGPVSAVAGGAENARYARFLAEGSAPAEMSVRPRDGGAPQAFFAADVAVVLRQESGVPLVSLNIKPHNYGPEELAALPPFIEGKVQTARGGPAIEFVVRLPNDRTPDSAGLIRTGWSLCPDCIGLDDSGTRVVQSRKLGSARVVAGAGVGAAANPELRFVESPARRVMLGEEADPALAVFAEAEARREAERKRLAAIEAEKARIAKEKAEEEERLYGDQRRAYAAFVKEHKGSPLARARAAKCGKLKLRGTPNSRNADRSDYSGRMKQNAQRFEKHVGCVTDFLETADYASLAEEAAAAETREEELFIAANLPGDDRGVIFTLDAMIEEEDAYLKKTADRFEDTAEDFEDGWRDFVEVQEERARERAAKRRRAKIEQETTNCLMGLAAGGNLTPYSQGYCKAQAERGISGLAAARMGSAGSSSSSTSSSNTSSLLYTRPQMPKFDLQGMMDNARVAAETGNTSVLWDKSGAIRTSRAPNLPRPSVTSRNRSDERRTSSRNSRGAVSASDSSSAIEKARSAAAEAAEKASATARAEEERVAASEQEREEIAKAEAEAAAKAEAEAKEQERAERAAAEAEAEKAREAAAERERQEKEAARRLAELSKPVARSGGSLGCVGVVDTKRIPGSSALSSCPYSQPDREALFITFVNRCTFPVNIEVDLAYDTGESRKSGEYDVKPGRNRKTVGHCGATNYDYRYEETRDSVSSRGG